MQVDNYIQVISVLSEFFIFWGNGLMVEYS